MTSYNTIAQGALFNASALAGAGGALATSRGCLRSRASSVYQLSPSPPSGHPDGRRRYRLRCDGHLTWWLAWSASLMLQSAVRPVVYSVLFPFDTVYMENTRSALRSRHRWSPVEDRSTYAFQPHFTT